MIENIILILFLLIISGDLLVLVSFWILGGKISILFKEQNAKDNYEQDLRDIKYFC